MRSRDGSSTLSRSICSLILLSSLTLNAAEYLISYRYVVKDATLYNEELYISHAMKKCEGVPQKPLFLESDGSDDLKNIIDKNNEKFIEYVHKLGLDVNHKDTNINLHNSSTTILTLKTTCFKVDFNDNLAKIAPLK